ncbi:hypothetical protein BRC81_10990 [Halobacteriales archaeon QS_1_68_20]|nr:MAG: hypothetical protein BRC81_10990 [Halobacteriales archaeon QS_1_68_20]
MRTQQERFETAVDDASEPSAREAAIDDLRTANECDLLARIVRRDDLADSTGSTQSATWHIPSARRRSRDWSRAATCRRRSGNRPSRC